MHLKVLLRRLTRPRAMFVFSKQRDEGDSPSLIRETRLDRSSKSDQKYEVV